MFLCPAAKTKKQTHPHEQSESPIPPPVSCVPIPTPGRLEECSRHFVLPRGNLPGVDCVSSCRRGAQLSVGGVRDAVRRLISSGPVSQGNQQDGGDLIVKF